MSPHGRITCRTLRYRYCRFKGAGRPLATHREFVRRIPPSLIVSSSVTARSCGWRRDTGSERLLERWAIECPADHDEAIRARLLRLPGIAGARLEPGMHALDDELRSIVGH